MRALAERWKLLGARERLLAGSIAGVAIVIIAFATFVQRDTRLPLFAAPLRSDQVAEVVERLAEWNEAFVALPDNVRVEAKRRNDLLLRLSLAGVPHAHLATSAEALENAGPLTPQSVLDAQQRDGLAGDLAAALRGLPGIEDARVIIAPARDGTFSDEATHAATASVKLDLKPGATPSHETLEGVRQFVAAGVPGLDAKRVAILDDRGLALGDASTGASPGEAQSLQASLQSALDLALGAGAAIVRVRVSYDTRNRERHDITRRPVNDPVIAATTADEHFKSASKTYEKTSRAVDRGSVTEDERTDTPAGRVERISVAIAVDERRRFDLQKIGSLATGTLGLVASRGDTVSVEEIAFPHPTVARGVPFAEALGLVGTLAPPFVLAFAVLAGLKFAAKPVAAVVETVVQRIAIGRATRAVATFAPAHVRGALQNEPPHTAAAIISALPAATATAVLDMYPAEERAAIVRRMSRPAAPVVPDYETVLRRG